MEEKANQNPVQDYCFHTHTERCKHAAKDTGDEEYVKNAIKGGIKTIAFTDHIPMPEGLNNRPNSRMDMDEFEPYIKSIENLKRTYEGQIIIESGVEFEFAEEYKGVNYLQYLQGIREKTDKMVLGQHWIIDRDGKKIDIGREKEDEEISSSILDEYVESICNAIKNDLPDIIAHPDLFMKARNKFGPEEKAATRKICEEAIKNGIPLEINFGLISKYNDLSKSDIDDFEEVSYPSKEFWEYVAQISPFYEEKYGQKLKVLFGKDAHSPLQLSTEKDLEIAIRIIGIETLEKLHFVKEDLKTIDTQMSEKLKRYKDREDKKTETEEQEKMASQRKIVFFRQRKIGTPIMMEAKEQMLLDLNEMTKLKIEDCFEQKEA